MGSFSWLQMHTHCDKDENRYNFILLICLLGLGGLKLRKGVLKCSLARGPVLYSILQVGAGGVLCTGMWEAESRLHKLLAWQCE